MNKAEKIRAEIKRLKQSNKALVEDCPYYDGLTDSLDEILSFIDSLEEEPVSNDLEEAAKSIGQRFFPYEDNIWARLNYEAQQAVAAFKAGAQWQKENLWKDAQGDDLPEIDREVIVLVKSLPEHEDSLLKVTFAHRPPEYWEGKNIGTGKITRYEPKRYDKGGWNQPDVVYWLDAKLPKTEE